MRSGPDTPAGDYRTGFLGKDSPTEHARLTGIQSSVDAFTTGVLTGLGLAPDWTCLELGAGAGSIAYWLAEQCPQGRVEAVDVDVRLLDAERCANLNVVEADITAEDFAPGRFDLVHARFVLCHLPGRDHLITRAVDWLKPGGWLVVTDPYQLPAQTSPFPLVSRLMRAYEDAYVRHGADLTWARRLPTLLAHNGLAAVDFAGKLGCLGNLGNDRWRPLLTQVAPDILAHDAVRPGDLDAFVGNLDDPAFIDIPQFTLAAWGRRLPSLR